MLKNERIELIKAAVELTKLASIPEDAHVLDIFENNFQYLQRALEENAMTVENYKKLKENFLK